MEETGLAVDLGGHILVSGLVGQCVLLRDRWPGVLRSLLAHALFQRRRNRWWLLITRHFAMLGCSMILLVIPTGIVALAAISLTFAIGLLCVIYIVFDFGKSSLMFLNSFS